MAKPKTWDNMAIMTLVSLVIAAIGLVIAAMSGLVVPFLLKGSDSGSEVKAQDNCNNSEFGDGATVNCGVESNPKD
jgi:hypothetical protein